MKAKNIQRQGPCGAFCFMYYLEGGCPNNCIYDFKNITNYEKQKRKPK